MQLYKRQLYYSVLTHNLLMAVAKPMNYIFNTYVILTTERKNDDYDDYHVM